MKLFDKLLIRILLVGCALLVVGVTVGVNLYVFGQGGTFLSPAFFLENPGGIPVGTAGGVFPAIVGTLYLGVLSAGMGGSLALAGALYLVFYCRNKWLCSVIQGAVHCLSGFPSILFGLTGYTLLVYSFGLPRSLMTASITIAALIFPFIFIRMQKLLRERYLPVMTASLSLGVGRGHCLCRLILPDVWPQLVAAVLLGMSYGMGAAAPVIYTGAVTYAGVPDSVWKPFMSLPYHLYLLVSDGISIQYAYGTACVLILLLLAINLLCRLPGWLRGRERV
ncbi:MAG: PstA family ABC transporter permease [Lachnospiraceae bacterium]